jgi:hypothetical protein
MVDAVFGLGEMSGYQSFICDICHGNLPKCKNIHSTGSLSVSMCVHLHNMLFLSKFHHNSFDSRVVDRCLKKKGKDVPVTGHGGT